MDLLKLDCTLIKYKRYRLFFLPCKAKRKLQIYWTDITNIVMTLISVFRPRLKLERNNTNIIEINY